MSGINLDSGGTNAIEPYVKEMAREEGIVIDDVMSSQGPMNQAEIRIRKRLRHSDDLYYTSAITDEALNSNNFDVIEHTVEQLIREMKGMLKTRFHVQEHVIDFYPYDEPEVGCVRCGKSFNLSHAPQPPIGITDDLDDFSVKTNQRDIEIQQGRFLPTADELRVMKQYVHGWGYKVDCMPDSGRFNVSGTTETFK